MTLAIAKLAPMTPRRAGVRAGGALSPTIMYEPEVIPAPPIPAIARPMMRAVEVGATAQMRLPTSKMKTAKRKTVFTGKYL